MAISATSSVGPRPHGGLHFHPPAQDGWFWVIPLRDEIISVGFVGTPGAFKRGGGSQDFCSTGSAKSRTLSERMQDAELASDVMTAGNYSYRARAGWGEGYMMIGDAFAFVDPVFSSGVMLAMTGGELGPMSPMLGWMTPQPDANWPRSERRLCRHGPAVLADLSHQQPALRNMLMAPRNRFRMHDGLVALLAGNLDDRPYIPLRRQDRLSSVVDGRSPGREGPGRREHWLRVTGFSRLCQTVKCGPTPFTISAPRSSAWRNATAAAVASRAGYVAAKLRLLPVHRAVLALAADEALGDVSWILAAAEASLPWHCWRLGWRNRWWTSIAMRDT